MKMSLSPSWQETRSKRVDIMVIYTFCMFDSSYPVVYIAYIKEMTSHLQILCSADIIIYVFTIYVYFGMP
jgi:hypothetical protein